MLFLSTPSARRATHHHRHSGQCRRISIHALREEGDQSLKFAASQDRQFLSTPSARRATYYLFNVEPNINDFYPRPPRGGRLLPMSWTS